MGNADGIKHFCDMGMRLNLWVASLYKMTLCQIRPYRIHWVKIRKWLVKWIKSELLPSTDSDLIRPVGSIRLRFYDLTKTHKYGVPLRPIFSKIGSTQHKVAKWVTTIFQPMLDYYSIYCIKNFNFSSFIKGYSLSDKCTCSFDVCSLFTCLPLLETIDIEEAGVRLTDKNMSMSGPIYMHTSIATPGLATNHHTGNGLDHLRIVKRPDAHIIFPSSCSSGYSLWRVIQHVNYTQVQDTKELRQIFVMIFTTMSVEFSFDYIIYRQ